MKKEDLIEKLVNLLDLVEDIKDDEIDEDDVEDLILESGLVARFRWCNTYRME